MLVKGSILQCQHTSPTASFGPRKFWRHIEPWHQHDNESPGCVSPTKGVHGPSWRCRRPCRTRWLSSWTTRRRYSWRRMAPTLAQLLECRPEEMAALGDWQNKGDQPDVGQMAFHYSSAKYAASIKIKSLVWGAASKLTDQLSWEAIPQADLDPARSHGLAEAERLLRQDRQPFQDVRKRLKLSQQFMEAGEKARQEADAVASPLMPDQLNGKVLTATLKNGRAISEPCRRLPLRSALMCHPSKVRSCLRRKTRCRCLQHQAGSHGNFVSPSCSQTFSNSGARSLG